MSDIQEEQKRLYKRAEENDYIVKDIAQYEENDSKLAKYTILELQDRINKAISYIKEKGVYNEEYNLCTQPINSMKLDELLNILEGNDNNE